MIVEMLTSIKITPAEGMHLRRISTGEMYPDYIYPAVGLTANEFDEVDEATYQEYLAAQETEEGGEVYSDCVYLGKDDTPDRWTEVVLPVFEGSEQF